MGQVAESRPRLPHSGLPTFKRTFPCGRVSEANGASEASRARVVQLRHKWGTSGAQVGHMWGNFG